MSTPNITGQRRNGAAIGGASAVPMPMTRRRFLHVAGGVGATVATAAVGGGAYRAVDQGVFATGEGPAYAAWSDAAGKGGDGPLNLVRAAVLASNAHDSQPWLFRVAPTRIDLFADPGRGTGANDALGRELIISLGCALENLLLAAGPNGLAATSALFPDPADPNHAARIDLAPGKTAASALFDAIPNRHTDRAAYKQTPVAAESLAEMTALNDAADVSIVWFTAQPERRAFADLTVKATEAYIADTGQSVDSFAWWRGDWDELQRRKDGVTLDAAGLPPLTRALGKLLPDISRAQSDDAWLKGTKDPQVSTAAAFGVIVVRDHRDAVQRLQTGRFYQRMHLWTTANALAMQPLNQTVERRDRELAADLPPEIGRALDALMPEPGWQAVMPFRIGHPAQTPRKSPRRPAEEVVLA